MNSDGLEAPEQRISRQQFVKTIGAGSRTVALGGAISGSAGGFFTEVTDGAVRLTSVTDQLGWLKISQYTGFCAAELKGFYKKQGLDVIVNAGGPNIIASQVIGAGKALTGDDDNTTTLQAIDKGLPLLV